MAIDPFPTRCPESRIQTSRTPGWVNCLAEPWVNYVAADKLPHFFQLTAGRRSFRLTPGLSPDYNWKAQSDLPTGL